MLDEKNILKVQQKDAYLKDLDASEPLWVYKLQCHIWLTINTESEIHQQHLHGLQDRKIECESWRQWGQMSETRALNSPIIPTPTGRPWAIQCSTSVW